MSRIIACAAALSMLAAPALAAEPDPKAPQSIAMEAVALPVIVKGQLLNYVFVSIRLNLSPQADGALVRAKEAFIRDDLVRTGHRAPFTRMDDFTRVDEGKVKAELMRYAVQIMGPGVVQSATITKQASQKLLTLPAVAPRPEPEIVP